MSVRVHLDNPYAFYTNLDFISGRIVLNLTSDETISAIIVKLEGESKTVLIKPGEYTRNRRDERDRVASENHKILYKLMQVFPPSDQKSPTSGLAYTLPPGQHEYPFNFKIPFNNGCGDPNAQRASIGFGSIRLMEIPSQIIYSHVQKTLPPSLSGFPGEAEIRYYVKVTVQRPSLFKGNRRSAAGFKFLPIEPIRPAPSNAEAFARRPHAFKAGLVNYPKKGSMFKKPPKPMSNTPPSVLVDARLPSPAILTCNKPVPLRLLIKKEADSPEVVFLMALQIDLIGFTHVRAQDLQRTEVGTWNVLSLGTLSTQIGEPGDPVGTLTTIDSKLWENVRLPPTVTPSFHTCNLTRTYELQLKVIIGYGNPGDIQPQTQMIPLKFPVEVYSGIEPPAALVDAMTSRPHPPQFRPNAAPANVDPAYPPQLGTPAAAMEDEAPPSYEDAIADEIGPVDGNRVYSGVTNENAPSDVGDEKAAAHSARPGEKSGNSGRLFPGSGPGPRPGSGSGSSGGFVV